MWVPHEHLCPGISALMVLHAVDAAFGNSGRHQQTDRESQGPVPEKCDAKDINVNRCQLV